MEEIEKKLKFFKTYLIVSFVALAIAVVLVIVGVLFNVLLALLGGLIFVGGIAGLASSLYMSLYWRSIKKVCVAIKVKKLEDTESIAKDIKKDLPSTRNIIRDCFFKKYLEEYVQNGEKVLLKKVQTESKHEKIVIAVNCPHCGANFEAEKGKIGTCPYCEAKINL